MRADIVTLYKRAIKLAQAFGHYKHADDFAGWYICRVLEGKSQHQLIKHALFDYFDKEFRYAQKQVDLIIPQIPDDSKAFTQEDKLVVMDLVEKHATALEKRIFELYLVEGYLLKEIGEMFGVTESRIGQRFTEFVKRVHEKEYED